MVAKYGYQLLTNALYRLPAHWKRACAGIIDFMLVLLCITWLFPDYLVYC